MIGLSEFGSYFLRQLQLVGRQSSTAGSGLMRRNLPDQVFSINCRSVPPADSHADFSNLQCDSDLAGGARAAARDEFQSVVDMGALGPPPFSAARSGALGSDKSQPSAHASAFAAIASRGNLPRSSLSPRAE